MYNTILLAVSPSVRTDTAPVTAFALARANNARLIVFHALSLPCNSWCEVGDMVSKDELVNRTQAKIAESFAKDLEGIDAEIFVTASPAPEELVALASREGADLIVMGHHTAESPEDCRRMWGMVDTTVDKVCAHSHCPVLVITDRHESDLTEIKRVVMATDLSTPSDNALCQAASIARAHGAKLDIFHVLDVGLSYPNPKYYQQDMNYFISKAKERMHKRYGELLDGIDYELQCWEGIPYTELLKYARWNDSDLIVMARHSSIKDSHQALIGSTVVQVALSPSCPTMVVNYRAKSCI